MSNQKEFVGGYVGRKLKRDLEKVAKAEERSINWMLEKMLSDGVKRRMQSADEKTAAAN